MEKKSVEKEQEILTRLRQDIIDNNLHVKAIIQVSTQKMKFGTSSLSILFIFLLTGY